MENGSIKRLMDKGFGFIKPEGGGKDIFFHSSKVINGKFDDLREGQQVTFKLENGPKGPAAVDVDPR